MKVPFYRYANVFTPYEQKFLASTLDVGRRNIHNAR